MHVGREFKLAVSTHNPLHMVLDIMVTFTGPVPKGLDFNTALAAERDRLRSRQLQRRLSDSFVRYVII